MIVMDMERIVGVRLSGITYYIWYPSLSIQQVGRTYTIVILRLRCRHWTDTDTSSISRPVKTEHPFASVVGYTPGKTSRSLTPVGVDRSRTHSPTEYPDPAIQKIEPSLPSAPRPPIPKQDPPPVAPKPIRPAAGNRQSRANPPARPGRTASQTRPGPQPSTGEQEGMRGWLTAVGFSGLAVVGQRLLGSSPT
jgi:hypothetical protein